MTIGWCPQQDKKITDQCIQYWHEYKQEREPSIAVQASFLVSFSLSAKLWSSSKYLELNQLTKAQTQKSLPQKSVRVKKRHQGEGKQHLGNLLF